MELQTAHRHQPEAQGSVHQWYSLLWTGPHLLWITLHIDPLTVHRLFNPLTPFTTRNHLTWSSPPETALLLMDYYAPSEYCQRHLYNPPLKHLSCITYCVCSVPLYTLGIIPIHLNVSILILNINHYRYLAIVHSYITYSIAMQYITLSGEPHNALHSPSISLPVRQEVDGLVHPGIHSEQSMPLKLRPQTT